MSVFDDKNKLLRLIAAQKTLAEGMPNKFKSTGISMLKKKLGAIKFVKDVLKILAGAKAIRAIIVTMLARDLPKIERFIKNACKCQLKEMINCGNDPEIPDYLKYTGAGINIKLRNTDYFGLFTIDPLSEEGKLLYQDSSAGLNSKDMHTFLYETIQNENLSQNWGEQTTQNPIMNITYLGNTQDATNVINIKASEYYSEHKTLTDLNNDYIDSLTLLPTAQMFNQIIDSVLGVVSFKVKLPIGWLKKREEVDKVIEKLITEDEEIEIDDSFFSFSNQELWDINQAARLKSQGVTYFTTCDNIEGNVDLSTLTSATKIMETVSTKSDMEKTIDNTITMLTDEVSKNANEKEKFAIHVEFFDKIFKAIQMTMANAILSPKMALLFQINHKLVYGEQAPEFETPIDFISKNRVLFRAILGVIAVIVLTILMREVNKKLIELVNKNKVMEMAERATLYKAQIISLIGVSPAIIKLMKSLKF